MADIPSQVPGEWGKRQYEVQILVPNKHREGERWRALGEPYNELAKAEYAIDDLLSSMLAAAETGMSRDFIADWRKNRVRVMEKLTECRYGREIAIPG